MDGVRGAGAKIAIVDSGIYKSHPDIGKIAAQKNFFNGDTVVKTATDTATAWRLCPPRSRTTTGA